MPTRINVPKGTVFSRLTVIKEVESQVTLKRENRQFLCECECGNKTKVVLSALRCGNTNSCGCYKVYTNSKHGLYKHPLYRCWQAMLDRCYNKNHQSYINYGGRGIKVCKEWRGDTGLQNFIRWNESLPKSKRKKKGLELDRERNNEGYKPSNCRWVTVQVNSLNRRTNRIVTYKGDSFTFIEFWKKHNKGISYGTAKSRVTRGMDPVEAVLQSKCR